MTSDSISRCKVAVVHEWFSVMAGSEKVVEQICFIFPSADIFCIYADPEVKSSVSFLKNKTIHTSFIQRMPFAKRLLRAYLPLMPLAVEQLDLSKYDVIISSAHAVSKGVLTGPDQLHISYVHSPMRYAWDLQHQYLRESGLDKRWIGWIARWMLHRLRIWDARTSNGVDFFLANSHFIARRIRRVYGRAAQVINPPVDINAFSLVEVKEDFYLTASRMVPYKKMDLIVQAFATMPYKKLVVIGDGPDYEKIRAFAGPNIKLLGYQSFEVLRDHMQRAKAFVFAAEEDFGIIPVEAQACGTPVIAFGKGGALETVVGLSSDQPTGVFFDEQTVDSLCAAVNRFDLESGRITPMNCRKNAERFSVDRFRQEFSECVAAQVKQWREQISNFPASAQ